MQNMIVTFDPACLSCPLPHNASIILNVTGMPSPVLCIHDTQEGRQWGTRGGRDVHVHVHSHRVHVHVHEERLGNIFREL